MVQDEVIQGSPCINPVCLFEFLSIGQSVQEQIELLVFVWMVDSAIELSNLLSVLLDGLFAGLSGCPLREFLAKVGCITHVDN